MPPTAAAPYDALVSSPTGPAWPPPPSVPPPPPRPERRIVGWFQAGDGNWYQTDVPPAPGWWLASDLRWYPPDALSGDGWWSSRWGLGDCWWAVLAYVVASVATSFALVGALMLLEPDTSIDDIEFGPYSISVSVLANVLVFGGIPWLASRRKGLASLADDFGLRFRGRDVGIGLGIGIGALVVGGVISTAMARALDVEDDSGNVPIDRLDGPGQIAAFAIAVAVVTPVIEELFFRGLLHRSMLKRGARGLTSYLVTTTVFVLPHLLAQPSWPNIAVLATSIFVFGSAFHLACAFTDNRLGAPIVAHAVVNGAAVIALAAA